MMGLGYLAGYLLGFTALESVFTGAIVAISSTTIIARAFDEFRGTGVPEGMRSLAIEVTLQPRDRTLTDAEIDAVAEKVVSAVTKATGGELRG